MRRGGGKVTRETKVALSARVSDNAARRARCVERLFEILHEDADLLVVNKPAGLVCHPTKGDVYSSLISRLRLHVGADNPVFMINRIDRETSGVVVVAKNALTAKQIGAIWAERAVAKVYWAIVHGHLKEDRGLIDAPLGKDERSEIAVKDCVRPDGKAAQTQYEVLRRFARAEGEFTWLRIELRTGRKHQIRIHLQHIGHPLVGEKLYGADEYLYLKLAHDKLTAEDWQRLILPCSALHARELRFRWADKDWNFVAEPENGFTDFLGAEIAGEIAGGGNRCSTERDRD